MRPNTVQRPSWTWCLAERSIALSADAAVQLRGTAVGPTRGPSGRPRGGPYRSRASHGPGEDRCRRCATSMQIHPARQDAGLRRRGPGRPGRGRCAAQAEPVVRPWPSRASVISFVERLLASAAGQILGRGGGSCQAAEQKVDQLRAEVDGLKRSCDAVFQARPGPDSPRVPEQRSALALRKLLGLTIRLEPVWPNLGAALTTGRRQPSRRCPCRRTYRDRGSDPVSTSVRWWRRRESNPRPEARLRETLQA